MFRVISFFLLSQVKLLCSVFYRYEAKFLDTLDKKPWDDVNLIVFLNHTSLFEPLFIRLAPYSFIWRLSSDLVAPGADITMERPVAGKFIKALLPGLVPISRKKDETWQRFLNMVSHNRIVGIIPEGRMMRKNGLDKHGKPMTVRGGVAEVLDKLKSGKILFVYSGGLHHIQSPGEKLPRLFKRIKANMEFVDIEHYKSRLSSENLKEFKQKVIADMEHRLKQLVPKD